jgi:predicted lipoprotein with Yx(FWY)xxD motif
MARIRSLTFLAGAAAISLTALALAACGGGGGGGNATVRVASTDVGIVLVNSKGRTLYLFEKDSGTTSACAGACARDWPPLRAHGVPTSGSGTRPSLVASSRRPDGESQVTYNGHPLYLYDGDEGPGDIDGQGVTAFGGAWYALEPGGTQVTALSSSSDDGPSGGGYGY